MLCDDQVAQASISTLQHVPARISTRGRLSAPRPGLLLPRRLPARCAEGLHRPDPGGATGVSMLQHPHICKVSCAAPHPAGQSGCGTSPPWCSPRTANVRQECRRPRCFQVGAPGSGGREFWKKEHTGQPGHGWFQNPSSSWPARHQSQAETCTGDSLQAATFWSARNCMFLQQAQLE